MNISEQVNALIKLAEERVNSRIVYDAMLQAADTIESLSAKLQAADMERSAKNRKIDQIRKMSTEELAGLMVFSDNGCWYSNLTGDRHWEQQDKAVNALVEILESEILENRHEP